MKPRRVLALRSETIGELSTEELTVVAGAAADHTTPLVACVSQALSCAIHDPHSLVCWVVSDYVC